MRYRDGSLLDICHRFLHLSEIFISKRRAEARSRDESTLYRSAFVAPVTRLYITHVCSFDIERRSACVMVDSLLSLLSSPLSSCPTLPVRWVKLTSARESKRKEGDVTSRLRRIKTSESYESAPSERDDEKGEESLASPRLSARG